MQCPQCLQEVDSGPNGALLNPKRDKVKHPSALHICPGKPVAQAVREKLITAMPNTTFEVVELLARLVQELQDGGAAQTVSDQAGLIPVLAQDMKRKAGGTGEDSQWLAAARQQIEDNKTTALTTSDDHYTGIEGGAKFDEIHELIHICSGPGGESPQHKWCLKMNEGAINYFAESISPKLGTPVVARYIEETTVTKKLVKLIGDPEASKRLFGATFKGKIDEFYEAVGAAYRKLGDKQPNGKPKGFSDKAYKTDQEAGKAFKDKAANWNLLWLNDRLPAA
jgi:hypothetical protein